MTNSEYRVLESELNNVKEDVKEIKQEIKENNSSLREAIEVLKDNLILQTQMLERTEQSNEYKFKESSREVKSVKADLVELKDTVNTKFNTETSWYREYLSTNTTIVLKIIFFVIMILSGLKLVNVDVVKLITGL